MTEPAPRPQTEPVGSVQTVAEPRAERTPVAPARAPSRSLKSALEWVLIMVGALVVALVVRLFVLQAFSIPSASMEATLHPGDRVLVNKLSYRLHEVNRGDIIVFERPKGDPGEPQIHDLIKRVVGLPGETIETRDGDVYINDRRLREPYLAEGIETNGIAKQKIPRDHYWVMGDNRLNSRDSRSDLGPIEESSVVGRAFVRVWPLSAFDLL